MNTITFTIKSLHVQNIIMLLFFGVAVSLLFISLIKKKRKHVLVFLVWVFLVLWFFNSPFFGFSVVRVSSEGIKVDYGILSIRNVVLPLDSRWKVETSLSGIRKNKRLYFITIGDRQSMKVSGTQNRRLLEEVGSSIEGMKSNRNQ